MKIAKCLLPFLLCLCLLFFSGCSIQQKSKVKSAITNELDLLKNLDSETTQKYLSYREIFPDATENAELSEQIQEVFSLFFKDFDYKILKIDVDSKTSSASARLRLKTIDAEPLAKDFCCALLRSGILSAAAPESEHTNDISSSLKARYLLLYQQLTQNTYKTIESDHTIQLTLRGSDWEIKRTHSLENALIGGFMSLLSSSDILSPEETLDVYLDTLDQMDLDQMSNYLGISSLLHSNDMEKKAIASALVEKVHTSFWYEITESRSIDSYTSEIKTRITTFDSDAILNAYQNEVDEYLGTAAAVIDGPDVRMSKSYELLLKNIETCESVTERQAVFHLVNDGISWKLVDSNEQLGSAIFGTLSSSPVEE